MKETAPSIHMARNGSADRSAAARVVERHGPAVMRTARRYSRTTEDAEDAYQRALEILFTRAPDLREPELVPCP